MLDSDGPGDLQLLQTGEQTECQKLYKQPATDNKPSPHLLWCDHSRLFELRLL